MIYNDASNQKDMLISVIIPIYNVEKYLEQCLESIINQTYKFLEIILVDDGSTDSGGKICDEYAKYDARISVIHKANGGLSDARNIGLENAHGDYIGFVDSDDYINADMYEKLAEACTTYNADITICGRRCFDSKGGSYQSFVLETPLIMDSKEAIIRLLLNDSLDSAAWDKLYRKHIFENIRYPFGVLHEDLSVTSMLFGKAECIVHIGTQEYNYRLRPGSITKHKFMKKKMDLLTQTEMLTSYVNNKYPDLSYQVESFWIRNITNLLTTVLKTEVSSYISEKKQLKHKIKEKYMSALQNPYLTTKDKCRLVYKTLKLNYILLCNKFIKT